MLKNPFKRKPKPPQVTIGGESVLVAPMDLEQTIKLTLLLSPHLAVIEQHLPRIQRMLKDTSGQRPQLLRALFATMREELADMPGDIFQAFAILLDKDTEWLAERRATATDLIEALPVLDQVNDFSALYAAVGGYGLTLRYRQNQPETGGK